ncbi:GDSL-type esterase/lipase family protein [Fusibacter bizertensis]
MKWKTTWSYLSVDYGVTIGSLENVTQRTSFWNNINGDKIRVKFTNLYGKQPIKIKEAVIAQKKSDSEDSYHWTHLTVNNAQEIVILPGQVFYSDIAELEICAGKELVISAYFEEKVEINSSCCTWSKESWHTDYISGRDYTSGKEHICENAQQTKQSYEVFPFIDQYMLQADVLVGISEISVLTDAEVKIITLFGDSITHMSFYADALAEMLYDKYPGKVAVLNKGIGGNKMLTDASYIPDIPGNGQVSGLAAIKRFEKDVYESETPEFVFLLEGVNDLMHPYVLNDLESLPKKEDLISAYIALASIAHKHGSQIYFSTILPFKHETSPSCPEGETMRSEINEWIRNQEIADGVFDFASTTAKNFAYMKDELHIGDGLHPNKAGGVVMAQTVLYNGGLMNGINTN